MVSFLNYCSRYNFYSTKLGSKELHITLFQEIGWSVLCLHVSDKSEQMYPGFHMTPSPQCHIRRVEASCHLERSVKDPLPTVPKVGGHTSSQTCVHSVYVHMCMFVCLSVCMCMGVGTRFYPEDWALAISVQYPKMLHAAIPI